MVALRVAAALIAAVATGSTGCTQAANTEDLQLGDCLALDGTQELPEALVAPCGSMQSNFKVIAKVDSSDQCPADADSAYTMRSGFASAPSTVCLDIDWVVGGCMSVSPQGDEHPVRADCDDVSAPNRQRAAQILTDVASVDHCVSGLGYAYEERQFTVCVENIR